MKVGTDCRHFGKYLSGPSTPDAPRYFECHSPVIEAKLGKPVCTCLEACSKCEHHSPVVFPQWEWAVGVTTFQTSIDRRIYFNNTISQIYKAGWDTPLFFSDGRRGVALGPFGNFYLAATDLYLHHPFATAYMLCQDDIEIDPESKKIVEQIPGDWLPPIISLYTAPELMDKGESLNLENWKKINEGHDSPGACCYIFSQAGLLDFLTDPVVLWHKRYGPTQGFRDIDGCVGIWATKHGGIYHHCPSLVKHIGEVSSIARD